MEFDYHKYHNKVREILLDHPYLRQGQVMFNILAEMYPDLAEEIRGTDLDPIHYEDGKRIYLFWEWVSKHEES